MFRLFLFLTSLNSHLALNSILPLVCCHWPLQSFYYNATVKQIHHNTLIFSIYFTIILIVYIIMNNVERSFLIICGIYIICITTLPRRTWIFQTWTNMFNQLYFYKLKYNTFYINYKLLRFVYNFRYFYEKFLNNLIT